LSYKASTPLQGYGINNILIDVQDKEIHRVQNIENEFQCRYKIMANRLLDSIRYTNDGPKGVILIQTNGAAESVFNDIMKSKAALETHINIYRVKERFNVSTSAEVLSQGAKVTDINVRRWKHLNGIGADRFSELCKGKIYNV
jgi:hypothetical protein